MKTLLTLTSIALLTLGCSESASSRSGKNKGPVPYPLDTCIVSDKPLGSMGEPVILEYNDHEIKFCCKSCKPKFLSNPDSYVQKLKGK